MYQFFEALCSLLIIGSDGSFVFSLFKPSTDSGSSVQIAQKLIRSIVYKFPFLNVHHDFSLLAPYCEGVLEL